MNQFIFFGIQQQLYGIKICTRANLEEVVCQANVYNNQHLRVLLSFPTRNFWYIQSLGTMLLVSKASNLAFLGLGFALLADGSMFANSVGVEASLTHGTLLHARGHDAGRRRGGGGGRASAYHWGGGQRGGSLQYGGDGKFFFEK